MATGPVQGQNRVSPPVPTCPGVRWCFRRAACWPAAQYPSLRGLGRPFPGPPAHDRAPQDGGGNWVGMVGCGALGWNGRGVGAF